MDSYFDVYLDKRVQDTLTKYNIARLCKCKVVGYKILPQDCSRYGLGTYNPPDYNEPAKVAICGDIIREYPQGEFDWMVLHECGHLYYQHPWSLFGRTRIEFELCADYWACQRQNTKRYRINALQRLCGGDTNRVSHDNIDYEIFPGMLYPLPPLRYCCRINALINSDLTY